MAKMIDDIRERLLDHVLSLEEIDSVLEENKYLPIETDEDDIDTLKYSNNKSQIWIKYMSDDGEYLVSEITMKTKKRGKTEVDPFYREEDIKNMIDYFRNNHYHQEFLITMFGFLLARRIGDILSLKWSDFYYENGRRKEVLNTLIEQKTDKTIDISVSNVTWKYIDEYCSMENINPLEHLNEDIFPRELKTYCQGKLLGKLSHAVSRNALNVDNLSEATLEKFISLGWLNSIKSIYHLSDYKGKMYSLEGFGKKSVDKLLESIEKSRETTLDRFIYALSVPLIGKSASKDIAKHFKYNFDKFYYCFSCGYGYFWNLKVDGIGVVASNNIQKFAITYMDKVFELSKEFTFKIPNESNHTQNTLQGKTFVITGSLEKYSNRDELKSVIESYGGKVSGSVSAKTFALINNDIESSSSKNKKAKSLGVQIINEEQFMQLIGE